MFRSGIGRNDFSDTGSARSSLQLIGASPDALLALTSVRAGSAVAQSPAAMVMRSSQSGFTLVEMVVITAVFTILAGMGINDR